jgi:hypothetical protein
VGDCIWSATQCCTPAFSGRTRETIRKPAAERLAREDGRSLANWLERLIEAEAARRDGKK